MFLYMIHCGRCLIVSIYWKISGNSFNQADRRQPEVVIAIAVAAPATVPAISILGYHWLRAFEGRRAYSGLFVAVMNAMAQKNADASASMKPIVGFISCNVPRVGRGSRLFVHVSGRAAAAGC